MAFRANSRRTGPDRAQWYWVRARLECPRSGTPKARTISSSRSAGREGVLGGRWTDWEPARQAGESAGTACGLTQPGRISGVSVGPPSILNCRQHVRKRTQAGRRRSGSSTLEWTHWQSVSAPGSAENPAHGGDKGFTTKDLWDQSGLRPGVRRGQQSCIRNTLGQRSVRPGTHRRLFSSREKDGGTGQAATQMQGRCQGRPPRVPAG